jgi:acid phosphatase type 7
VQSAGRRRSIWGLAPAAALIALALLAIALAATAAAESKVTLIPASGTAGTRTSVRGVDFGKRDRVVVRMAKRVVAKTRTNRRGSFRASFTVPDRRPGGLRVISRSAGRRIVNIFRIVAAPASGPPVGEVASRRGRRMRWTPVEGPVGSTVHVYGTRFPSRRVVRIRFGGVEVERLRTERGGRFSTRLTVPAVPAGRRLVRVKRRSRVLGFFFTITPPGTSGSGPGPPVGGSDPVIAAAGDIACDPTFRYFNKGLGTSSRCRQKSTSDLLVNAGLAAVLPLGDIQYECGGYSAFLAAYDPTWGRVKAITRPAIGNHEVHTSGGSGCAAGAAGYFRYFGPAAGDPSKGYYSYDLGAWHLIALNSNCSFVSCGSSSAQAQWLRQDLAAHPTRCTLAYAHHPRFTSGTNSPGSNSIKPLFQTLYDYGADVLLVGHDHHYERFAPQNPSGASDPARGIREFLVGTGGRGFHPVNTIIPNSEVRNNVTFGVLKLVLRPASYDWQFVPEAGATFRDAGSQMCH